MFACDMYRYSVTDFKVVIHIAGCYLIPKHIKNVGQFYTHLTSPSLTGLLDCINSPTSPTRNTNNSSSSTTRRFFLTVIISIKVRTPVPKYFYCKRNRKRIEYLRPPKKEERRRRRMENGALSQAEGKDPSGFLSEIIGNPVTVKLNSGVVYKGIYLLTVYLPAYLFYLNYLATIPITTALPITTDLSLTPLTPLATTQIHTQTHSTFISFSCSPFV